LSFISIVYVSRQDVIDKDNAFVYLLNEKNSAGYVLGVRDIGSVPDVLHVRKTLFSFFKTSSNDPNWDSK